MHVRHFLPGRRNGRRSADAVHVLDRGAFRGTWDASVLDRISRTSAHGYRGKVFLYTRSRSVPAIPFESTATYRNRLASIATAAWAVRPFLKFLLRGKAKRRGLASTTAFDFRSRLADRLDRRQRLRQESELAQHGRRIEVDAPLGDLTILESEELAALQFELLLGRGNGALRTS